MSVCYIHLPSSRKHDCCNYTCIIYSEPPFATPPATSHDASSAGQGAQAASDQKRQKKPKMSDAEVIAHLSESTVDYSFLLYLVRLSVCTSGSTCKQGPLEQKNLCQSHIIVHVCDLSQNKL